MPAAVDDGVSYAKSRENFLLVSKPVAAILEQDALMWNHIYIGSTVPLASLMLAVTKSASALLTISLGFTDFDYDGAHALAEEAYNKIRAIMELLVPHAYRFSRFSLTTEHPLVYLCVQRFCSNLAAPSLIEFDLDFWYMMRSSGFPTILTLYGAPLLPRTWFNDDYQLLRVLRVSSANLFWDTAHMFINLTHLEVVDVLENVSFTWSIFASMFESATSLVHLRIGNIVPFDLPLSGFLVSHSVKTFDISFDEQGVLSKFVSRLLFPGLTDLVYRMDECEFLEPALVLCDMLGQVTSFAFHGTARDPDVMAALFSSMRRVTVLDLSAAKGYPLRALHRHLCALAGDDAPPVLVPPLHTLTLRIVDHELLRMVLRMYKGAVSCDGSPIIIREVRIEDDGIQSAILPWFVDNVADFIYARYYSRLYCWIYITCLVRYRMINLLVLNMAESNMYADAGNQHPAAISTAANYSDAVSVDSGPVFSPIFQIATNVPNELLTAIFEDSCAITGPCDIDKWLTHRDNLRLVSRDVRRYIDATALFWSRFLVTARNISRFQLYVYAARGAPLHVTVRVPDALDHESETYDSLRDRIALLRETIMASVGGVLHQCAGLSIHATSYRSADFFLFGLEGHDGHNLEYISAGFATLEFADCEDCNFIGYAFRTPPAFGVPFTPPSSLAIIPSTRQLSTVTYISSIESSCIVRQARDDELDWESVMGFIDPSGYVNSLVLRDVIWTVGGFGVRNPYPLSTVTSLDVAFCGNLAMVDFISHLNLPNLRTLVLRFTSRRDLHLVSQCGALLVYARDVRLVAERSFVPVPNFSELLSNLYGLFHQVRRLDLSKSSTIFVESLIAASAERALTLDRNWNACPKLTHLALPASDLERPRVLVSTRSSVGYPVLSAIVVGGVDHTDGLSAALSHSSAPFNKSPYWLPLGSSLALELLSEIAGFTCGNYWDAPDEFLQNRSAWMLVSRQWRRAALATIQLWRFCDLHSNLHADQVELSASRLGHGLIDLRVKLDDYYYSLHRCEGRVSTERLLDLAYEYSENVRRLHVSASPGSILKNLVVGVCDQPLPNLRSLTVVSVQYLLHYSYGETEDITSTLTSPLDLDSLLYLRLSGFALSWTHLGVYSKLTALVLQSLPRIVAPSREQLHAVLSAAPNLVRLSLRDIQCSGGSNGLPPIDLSSLRYLDVRVGGHEGITDVLASVRAPGLDTVVIAFEHRNQHLTDLQLLIRCGTLWSTVRSFTAMGSSGGLPIVEHFYRLMPSLCVLDISDVHLVFFRTLTASADNPFFPHLSELAMSEMPRINLEALFSARVLAARLKVLRVRVLDRRITGNSFSDDFEYMGSHVDSLIMPYNYVNNNDWMDDWWMLFLNIFWRQDQWVA
ncbi:hypothetical protein C8R43DRAFT_957025 [Mycena crocata]|nr:hypothetical protein C8R43DRAFT_957025 [Mycena crocata]